MLKRSAIIFITVAAISLTVQAGSGGVRDDVQQPGNKVLRVLVEADASILPAAIENLRKGEATSGFQISFVEKSATDYNLRIILTAEGTSIWAQGTSMERCWVGYSSGVVLTGEGKLLFTVTRHSNTAKGALAEVSKEIIKGLAAHSYALKGQAQPVPEQVRATSGTPAGLSAEPGVYYKEGDRWVRLSAVSAIVRPKGLGAALLTGGLTGVRTAHMFPGAQAAIKITERRPVFHIQGYDLAEQGISIVRLSRKGDSREVANGFVSPFALKVGYKQSDLRKVAVTRLTNDLVSATPESDLEAGEYLLVLGRTSEADGGFDFSIEGKKK
jgi:hypothetical protein